jgi:3-oxoacyl-[acyl-carrier protein] reductase
MPTEESTTISPSRSLLDRVAIVTGSGQGIGRGVALCLARAGAHVVIADQVPERIAPAVAEVESFKVQALGIPTDVSRGADIQRMVQQTLERFGKIDILVNNAGKVVVKPMVEQSEADWDRVVDTNLRGVFLCCRYVVPEMIARQRGAIVNIASIAAFHVTVPHVPYAASKAGVVALTRDLAYEVARYGIRVNAIAPGPIATPMSQSVTAEQRQAITRTVPLGRMGQPEDIGEAAAFLVSDAASYITGATLPVSGGSDLRVFG